MSSFPNRRWLVIPISSTGSIDFDEVLEPNTDSLRLSLDGSETFIKYEINVITASYEEYYQAAEDPDIWLTSSYAAGTYGRPSIYNDNFIKIGNYQEYGHSEILNLLTGSNWTESGSIT